MAPREDSLQSRVPQAAVKPILAAAALFASLCTARAAIWPEQFEGASRTSVHAIRVSNPEIWDEYGLEESEAAEYGDCRAAAYRLHDSTGALASFEWQRPKDAVGSKLGQLAAETTLNLILAHGNYLLIFDGKKPQAADIEGLYRTLPKLDQSPLPALRTYLPVTPDLVPNSERYLTGPLALERFYPGIPASVVAFHLGAEAQIGTYRNEHGDSRLAIFSYPTPAIARDRLAALERVPGAVAKRAGPMVAVILAAANADDAEKILALVRYQAQITWSERIATRRDNIGDLIVNIFLLIGILLAFSAVSGVAVGGLRTLLRRAGKEEPEAFTSLHLEDR